LKPINLASQADFFLSVGALVPYKKVDLTVEAFNRLKELGVI